MTDQPKWTPGPWAMETVRTSCGTCHRIGPFPRPAHASKPEGWACVYDDYPPGVGSPDLLANSHLIAAAPDLYSALEKALNFITNTESEMGETLPCGDAARAALAKARGETK